MEAIIASFRRGRHTQNTRQIILKVESVTSKKGAEKFIGKQVVWQSTGKNKKTIKGKITSLHGNKGLLRAVFEKGLPGQAITGKVKIN